MRCMYQAQSAAHVEGKTRMWTNEPEGGGGGGSGGGGDSGGGGRCAI